MKENERLINMYLALSEEIEHLEEIFFSNNKINDYSVIILKYIKLYKTIIAIMLSKNNVMIIDDVVIIDNKKMSILDYCFTDDSTFISPKIKDFAYIIANYEKRISSITEISENDAMDFILMFKSYSYLFMQKEIFPGGYNVKTKEKCNVFCNIIDRDIAICIEIEKNSNSKKGQVERALKYATLIQKDYIDKCITKKIDYCKQEYKKVVQENTEKYMEQIKGYLKRMEYRLVEMNNKMDSTIDILLNISKEVNSCQALVQKQISAAVSNDEVERIIQIYVDDCARKIVFQVKHNHSEEIYKDEEIKLKLSLGNDVWNKMSEDSKTFLISSKVMYFLLLDSENVIDYSGVCVLIAKALEVEMKRRFYYDYIEYLKGISKGGSVCDSFPYALRCKKNKLLEEEHFSLGKVPFIMCYRFKDRESESDREKDKKHLLSFAKNKLCIKGDDELILKKLSEYGNIIEKITKEYRNEAAHVNKLQRIDAEECFDLVVDVEKLLKKMLDQFAY